MILNSKRPPIIRLFDDEIAVDNFAGGGGASTGIEMVLGRSPHIAINHDAEALAMHASNHPETKHLQEDLFDVDPVVAAEGRPIGLAWFSPDCTYHSKARGSRPFRDRRRARRIRGLAWVMVRWAYAPLPVRPRVIFMENVEEIAEWGPLGIDGRPDPARRGKTWRRLVARLRNAGYVVDWRVLRACHFGAPTSRKRLFMIARRDGQPIVWPEATHGPKRSNPYRTAAECIDFSLPVPSIFMTKTEARAWADARGVPAPRRPLAPATLRRIARGTWRYVINDANPFIVPGEFVPFLINTRNGERHGRHGEQAPRVLDIHEPYPTITALGSQGAIVAAFLAKHNGGHEATGQRLTIPADTFTVRENKSLVASHLIKLRGGHTDHVHTDQDMRSPVSTLTAGGNHLAHVAIQLVDANDVDPRYLNRAVQTCAFLVKFFGTGVARPVTTPMATMTTKDRVGLVTVILVNVGGSRYILADIGMRMIVPREMFRAQGFPDTYMIDSPVNGALGLPAYRLSKKAQTRLAGNSVPPHITAALVAANLRHQGVVAC